MYLDSNDSPALSNASSLNISVNFSRLLEKSSKLYVSPPATRTSIESLLVLSSLELNLSINWGMANFENSGIAVKHSFNAFFKSSVVILIIFPGGALNVIGK